MEAWDLISAVLASSMSVGSLVLGGWSLWYGFKGNRDDEIQSLFFIGPLVFVPQSIIFGFYGCAEAWVFVGVVTFVGAVLLCMRSILESVN
jgi:hypothetical protein